jgi:hypothetical protein
VATEAREAGVADEVVDRKLTPYKVIEQIEINQALPGDDGSTASGETETVFRVVQEVDGSSIEDVVRKYVRELSKIEKVDGRIFLATPARSWRPTRVRIEHVEQLRLG